MNQVKVQTKYDKRTYTALTKHMMARRIIVVDSICLLLIIAGIVMYFLDFNKIIAIIYGSFGIVMPIVLFIIYKLMVVKTIKESTMHNGENMVVDFILDDNHVELHAVSSKGEAHNQFKYSNYYKMKESKDFFFLFLTPNQAQALDKKELSDDDLEKVKEILYSMFKKTNK